MLVVGEEEGRSVVFLFVDRRAFLSSVGPSSVATRAVCQVMRFSRAQRAKIMCFLKNGGNNVLELSLRCRLLLYFVSKVYVLV